MMQWGGYNGDEGATTVRHDGPPAFSFAFSFIVISVSSTKEYI